MMTLFDRSSVQLVDDRGMPAGTAPKATVHGTDTPLHLAFSCHIQDGNGSLLVTRRALTKATWPGVWSNSFCGHPAPGEPLGAAVRRRAREELGVELADVTAILPTFRYRATDASGMVENEICPVFRARVTTDPLPAPDEICEWQWTTAAQLRAAVVAAPYAFSPWLRLQLRELHVGAL
ncbi:isopentenyl-diphosphate Delta-isomerase [Sinomonas sp. G460-2]|uniref:isopentenyl-diphosphate Delta-isomerase n=1 Tax=Sinomonas sp. G460-2 TaxID=3393464 RepID=UPI0039EF4966